VKASWLTIFAILLVGFSASMSAEVVTFPSGTLELKGVVYKPEEKGPFPAVLYTGVRCGVTMYFGFWMRIAGAGRELIELVRIGIGHPLSVVQRCRELQANSLGSDRELRRSDTWFPLNFSLQTVSARMALTVGDELLNFGKRSNVAARSDARAIEGGSRAGEFQLAL
jgi:hypothetical protein